ncbi:hypothetical protein OHA25_06550 [Nonomuraea sp. NBC_00507]|uniref:hypothetical protein n=1 Tax=Nonomuraea sp. NBC_00507 TaxID=2976002 RepID=UPI002E19D05D
MAEQLDDLRGVRLTNRLRPPRPVWVNLLFISFGQLILATQTLGLLAGKPWEGYEFLFGWDLGSWWWLGRVVIIVGWFGIVCFHVQDLLRKRGGRGVSSE